MLLPKKYPKDNMILFGGYELALRIEADNHRRRLLKSSVPLQRNRFGRLKLQQEILVDWKNPIQGEI